MADAPKSNNGLGGLEKTLEVYFVDKAPFALPEDVKEIIVKFGPWVMLVLMLMSLPFVFAALGLTAMMSPFAFIGGYSGVSMFAGVVTLISMVLTVIALPGLLKRSITGWRFAFYSEIASIVGSLLAMQVIGAIISAIIGFYILFQIKSKYK